MTFEIDTGSGVSIISEETYFKHFSRIKLMLSNTLSQSTHPLPTEL